MSNKIYIASTNPVKIEAAREAFRSIYSTNNYEFIGIQTESGVGHQPMGDEETYRDAVNRTEFVFRNCPDGVFWVGIEGGIELIQGEMVAIA